MFLTELARFYEHKVAEPDSGIPMPGFSEEDIGYVIRISPDGEYIHHLSLMNGKNRSRRIRVPAAEKRSGKKVVPNFLWDNTGYVLGVDNKGNEKRSLKTFEAFRKKHADLAGKTDNASLKAVAAFLERWNPDRFSEWSDRETVLGKNIVFEIEGENGFVHEQPDVRELWQQLRKEEREEGNEEKGFCLVTGRQAPIARIHPAIRGLKGGEAKTALVSFNKDAFTSYGKEQSYNAPVSVQAAQAYTTALNWLLRAENGHSAGIGDTSIVFWTDKPAPKEEKAVFDFFGTTDKTDAQSPQAEDEELVRDMRGVFKAMRDGQPPEKALRGFDPQVRFFILGIAPNSARIAVRFWQTATFGELAERLGRYYAELSLEPFPDRQPEFPAFWQILNDIFGRYRKNPEKKELKLAPPKQIPPKLGDTFLQSVLAKRYYPTSLYTAVLQGIRADQTVSYLRAAVIKAYLIRNQKQEFAMSLDTERKDVPYLLGRLFSLLEKNQRDALGKNINSTIRDRYIASASATPRRVFPLLLRLTQHHISKSEYERSKQNDIAGVVNDIRDFPATLTLEEQGVFFLGYYQQNTLPITLKKIKEQNHDRYCKPL